MRARTWFMVALVAVGCSERNGKQPPDRPDAGLTLGDEDCPDLACLACSTGTDGCAPAGDDHLGETCCDLGDPLQAVGTGPGSEVVDLEYDGTRVYLCGGFGCTINDVSDPAAPRSLGTASRRCQRIGIGATLADGAQVFYLAHHGDTWVATPFLKTFHVDPAGTITEAHSIEDRDVLFEGLHYRDGVLYVAAHGGGVRVYDTDAMGRPSFVEAVGGMSNAWKLDSADGFLYVADQWDGLHVLSLADPRHPALVATVPTTGSPRDVDVSGGRLYVALGGSGVDVFDVMAPGELSYRGTIDGMGSVQAVSADGNLLALASWSHVALRDATTFQLLATERTREAFEQDLGVVLAGNTLFVGEWEGLHVLEYREGYVAPDLWIEEDLFELLPDEVQARAVIVRNRGLVDLVLASITIDDPAFSLDRDAFAVPPGGADVFEMTFQPPATLTEATLTLVTNDPDPWQGRKEIAVKTQATAAINVGDRLPDHFGFLDPNGAGQVSGLEGKVVVLAYFALF